MEPLFNEDQLDCLGELINVAYGTATARLAEIMGAFATMRPPQIAVIDNAQFRGILQAACGDSGGCYLARQVFRGDVSGEVVFLLEQTSALNITSYLKGQLNEQAVEDDDVLLELSNIVTAAMMGDLSAQMGARLKLGEPELKQIGTTPMNTARTGAGFDQVIKVETVIEFAEQHIHGRLFVLTHGHCIEWIRRTLDRVLDALPG